MADDSVSSKRKRKSIHTTETQSPSAAKPKSPQQRPRVFSLDDSLALLEAFHEILKDSPSPSTAATLLFNRIGKSPSVEITPTLMIKKIRKLRQKYTKQAEDLLSLFRNPYESEIFFMSEKIWGEKEKEKESPPPKRNSSSSSSKNAAAAAAVVNGKKKEVEPKKPIASDVRMELIPEKEKVDLWKEYSYLMEEAVLFPGNFDLKEGSKSFDDTQLEWLNNRWKLQQIREVEMLVKKFQEQNKEMEMFGKQSKSLVKNYEEQIKEAEMVGKKFELLQERTERIKLMLEAFPN